MLAARLTTDMGAALHLLQRAVPHAVDGTPDACELAAGEAVFDLVDGEGARVGAFTLSVQDGPAGRFLHCAAAGGLPGYDLVGAMAAFAECEARQRIGARRLVCETRRRGLVRRLAREGFGVAGYILTKDL